MSRNADSNLDDGPSSTASFEDIGRKPSEELVTQGSRFKIKEDIMSENVPDVKYVLQYKGLAGRVVESRESDEPFVITADSDQDGDSSLKPVIEIITTVSEAVNIPRLGRPHPRAPPPPPVVYYDDRNEFNGDNGSNKFKIEKTEKTEIVVHSRYLTNAFNAVIGSYPDTNFLGKTVSIEAPYYAFMHHRDALSRYRIAQPACHNDEYATITAQHIDILLSFLDRTYGDKIRDEEARHKRTPPAATFDLLWLLLKPGEVIYKKVQNVWTPFVISSISTFATKIYTIDCWDIRVQGGRMKRCMNVFPIQAFSGEQAISTLEVVPAAFFRDDFQKQDGMFMAEKQIAMGKMYWELVKRPAYKEYDGKLIDRDNLRTGHITGRVIVDVEGYDRFCSVAPDMMEMSRWPRHPIMQPPVPGVGPPIHRSLPQFSPRCSCKACKDIDGTSDAPGPFANFEDLNPLEDAPPKNELYFLVCSPNIPAFILSDRRWGHVNIAKLSEVKCDTEAFKYLVLDSSMKLTVKSLIGKFASNDGKVSPWPNDFVRNKGEGRIFLLHGSPGVGKTCTAECVAELTRRPLLSLTSGDISTSMSSSSVERNLNYFLTLGERYGALVLLDEADVYLEERRTRDLRRNGLVSIFLRALEYYRGVLFLTTNRVESFDPAFTSRIHVALHYKRLTDSDRARIWAHNFDRLERDSHGKVYVTAGAREYVDSPGKDKEVNGLRWNGREIRNALQTAVALAEAEADEEGLEREYNRYVQPVIKCWHQ
ncbi:ATPase family AAA domain-containing protein 3B [Cytospora mali]|uniref:ATPase family AAA domain-containing protein 3B n=1 Tax=Cytospora mali TaxID=578113 RepID=A0A194V2S0_CYTMA|nr:ATPase family AAA domain-containing protein 3B [Valsa mali var. pyri (nom. inval.)]